MVIIVAHVAVVDAAVVITVAHVADAVGFFAQDGEGSGGAVVVALGDLMLRAQHEGTELLVQQQYDRTPVKEV